jgi:beta-N-acetylhexosaminidase
MTRCYGTISLWIFGLVFLFVGVNINEPYYLISLRGLGAAALLIASNGVFVLLIKRGYWNGRGAAERLLILLWCLPSLSMLYAKISFEVGKRNVLRTDVARAHTLGRHFVVGYSSFDEVMPLAEKGLISGVYISRHNITGRPADALKSEIAMLQDARRIAGLPPLIVAADQEGGIVSHLSPPLSALPSLSTLADLPPNIRAKRAEEFGRVHGQGVSGDWRESRFCAGLGPAAGGKPQPV